MSWLLCDYGEVLSLAQPAGAVDALVAAADMAHDDFVAAYWAHRAPYDRGDIGVRDYWDRVLGRPVGQRLARLVGLDVEGWLRPNPAAVAAALRARDRGWRLALLSNAPKEVAAGIDVLPWLSAWSPRLYSWSLNLLKPEADIYRAALDRLDAEAGDVVFLDDRVDNVTAAVAAGMRAEVFTDPDQFDDLPDQTGA